MTSSNAPPKLSHRILMLTTAALLLAATDGALAKDEGNSHDRGAMKSSESSRSSGNHDAMKSHDSNRDHDHSDKVSERHKDKSNDAGKQSEPYKDMGKEWYYDKTKDKEMTKGKDKTPPATTVSNKPPAPGTGGTNAIHPIASPPPVASGAGKPTAVAVPVNTIHPIASPPPHMVTISDGVNTYQIPDGAGGVSVSSSRPGTITVSNGVQTQTVHGIKITISGALGVGVPKDIQVGRPNADGSTVIMSPLGTVTGSSPIVDAVNAVETSITRAWGN